MILLLPALAAKVRYRVRWGMQNLTLDRKIDLYLIGRGKHLTNLSGTLDDDGCQLVKERFGFVAVGDVTLLAVIKQISKDCWELKGRLVAQVTQICVATGQPVKEKLDITLEERYVLQNEQIGHIAEIDVNAANVEVLETNILQVGELIAQTIGIEADSFPKQKNTPEVHVFGSDNKDEHPFAKLSTLKK